MKPARLAPVEALEHSDALAPPWPGRALQLDGSAIYERVTPPTTPTAEPALYLHGLGGSSQNWTDVAGLLAGHLDGRAIDLPGFGRSDSGEPVYGGRLRRAGVPVDRSVGPRTGAPDRQLARWRDRGQGRRAPAGLHPDAHAHLPGTAVPRSAQSAQGRLVPLLALPRADVLAARRLAHIDPEDLTRQVLEACFGDPSPDHPSSGSPRPSRRPSCATTLPWYADAYVRTPARPGRQLPAGVPAGRRLAVAYRRPGFTHRRWSSAASWTGSSTCGWRRRPRGISATPG